MEFPPSDIGAVGAAAAVGAQKNNAKGLLRSGNGTANMANLWTKLDGTIR